MSVSGLTPGEPGKGWGRAESEAILGFPPSSTASAWRRWVWAAEGSLLRGAQRRRCGLRRPLPAEKRYAAPPPVARQGGVQAAAWSWPSWAQDYVTGEKGNESSPPGHGAAWGECGDEPQEPGTMAGSDRNVGLAAVLLPLRP